MKGREKGEKASYPSGYFRVNETLLEEQREHLFTEVNN